MKGPEVLVQHLKKELYHPRSDAHSNALVLAILNDLLDECPPIAQKAARGEIVAKVNHTVIVQNETWNVDLAIGPPIDAPTPPLLTDRITMAVPAVVEIGLEAKGVMTEHGKARRNRLRDFKAFHQYAHAYDPKVIAGCIVVVNMSEYFWSPTRSAADITRHKNVETLAKDTVDVYRSLPLRNSPADGAGLEAMCALVVSHDNILKNAALPQGAPNPQETKLVTKPPAPQPGDPLHYSAMIRRICTAYADRW